MSGLCASGTNDTRAHTHKRCAKAAFALRVYLVAVAVFLRLAKLDDGDAKCVQAPSAAFNWAGAF